QPSRATASGARRPALLPRLSAARGRDIAGHLGAGGEIATPPGDGGSAPVDARRPIRHIRLGRAAGMTIFDRFDPFERRIGEALEGIVPPRPLDYLDDVFRQTARTSQRPRWSFPERWFNVDTTFVRPSFGRNIPIRQLIVLGLLLVIVAATIAFIAGSRKELPPPIGVAANGQIAYGVEGDLY